MAYVTITATMNEDVAMQLAQFCKRSTFDQFYDMGGIGKTEKIGR